MNRDCKAKDLAGGLFFHKFVAKIPLLPEGDNKIFIRLKYFLCLCIIFPVRGVPTR